MIEGYHHNNRPSTEGHCKKSASYCLALPVSFKITSGIEDSIQLKVVSPIKVTPGLQKSQLIYICFYELLILVLLILLIFLILAGSPAVSGWLLNTVKELTSRVVTLNVLLLNPYRELRQKFGAYMLIRGGKPVQSPTFCMIESKSGVVKDE